jgi:pimeloyl-ACP methyl ester carboxylesterase
MVNDERTLIRGELVRFDASDGLVLHGFMAGTKGSNTCVLYVHGMGGNFYSGRLVGSLEQGCLREGFGFLSINTRGHDGESRGGFEGGGRKPIRMGTRFERFEDSKYDIDGAVKFARGCGFSKIVLVGHSTGCQKILYYQRSRKSRFVKALVFLAPDDDYNLNRKMLGRRFAGTVSMARRMIVNGKGWTYAERLPFSPRRFLSVADPNRIEARLFNYEGALKDFSSVRIPMLAAFGTADEGAVKPVHEYLDMLKHATSSRAFRAVLIDGATHSFRGEERETVRSVMAWLMEIAVK